MTTSPTIRKRNQQYQANITKRGLVSKNYEKKHKNKFSAGPIVIGFFLFVVIGSALFQLIQSFW